MCLKPLSVIGPALDWYLCLRYEHDPSDPIRSMPLAPSSSCEQDAESSWAQDIFLCENIIVDTTTMNMSNTRYGIMQWPSLALLPHSSGPWFWSRVHVCVEFHISSPCPYWFPPGFSGFLHSSSMLLGGLATLINSKRSNECVFSTLLVSSRPASWGNSVTEDFLKLLQCSKHVLSKNWLGNNY